MSEIKSTVTYDDTVIQKIIGHAIENIDGLLSVDGGFFSNIKEKIVNSDDVTTGVNVEVGTEEVATDLDIVVEYGKDIPSIADSIKSIIVKDVEASTHLKVVEINVNVVDVMTREEFEKASVTLQDRIESGYESVKESAKEAGQYISEKTSVAVEATSEKASEFAKATSEKASEVAEKTSEKASEFAEATSEKASEVAEKASEKASDLKEAASEKASEVAEKTSEKVEDLKESASEKGSEVSSSSHNDSLVYKASSESDVVVAD